VKKGIFTDISLQSSRKLLDDLQIISSNGHYGFTLYLFKPEDDLKHFVDRCTKSADTFGYEIYNLVIDSTKTMNYG